MPCCFGGRFHAGTDLATRGVHRKLTVAFTRTTETMAARSVWFVCFHADTTAIVPHEMTEPSAAFTVFDSRANVCRAHMLGFHADRRSSSKSEVSRYVCTFSRGHDRPITLNAQVFAARFHADTRQGKGGSLSVFHHRTFTRTQDERRSAMAKQRNLSRGPTPERKDVGR
jgi:hypothetical protein